jgi:predicted DNA-binding transcriptional regulator AlpA
MTDTLLLSLPQVVAYLGGGVGGRSIQRWVQQKKFPQPIKLGSRTVWRRADIEAFVEAGTIASYRRARTKT